MFALIDCNNFYASCERLFRPELISQAIVVLSNNDGCVIARSNEAKAIGIPMGAVAFEYDALFKKNNVYVFSANFALYGDMSKRVMDVLSDFSPDMEIYSIDEAFLKLKGYDRYNMEEFGKQIHQKVTQWTGIPVSVGIASTKALAKVANRIAKKYPQQTKNVFVMDTDAKRIKALRWLKVEDIWGIGRQHAKKLNSINIKTAYDFTQVDNAWIKKNLAIVGLRLKLDLMGIATLDLEKVRAKKIIATTRSFDINYKEFHELEERVVSFAVSCAEKLRKQNSCCNSLLVYIHSNRYRQDLPQYSRSISIKLPYPTNSSIEISKFASQGLKYIFKAGYQYKKAGVIIMDFIPKSETQLTFFENSNPRHVLLMKAMDKLNANFGQQKIKLGSQDIKRVWKMKQEKLSPRYTTKLNDIITIHVN